jgi:hypothetical protein
MNSRHRLSLVLLLTMAGVFLSGCRGNGQQVRVYYVPIGSETFSPITAESIEMPDYLCVVESKRANDLEQVLASSSPGEGTVFTPEKVRARIPSKGDGAGTLASFVDNNGVVRRGNEYRILSRSKLSTLKEILEHACLSKWKAEAEEGAREAAARAKKADRPL